MKKIFATFSACLLSLWALFLLWCDYLQDSDLPNETASLNENKTENKASQEKKEKTTKETTKETPQKATTQKEQTQNQKANSKSPSSKEAFETETNREEKDDTTNEASQEEKREMIQEEKPQEDIEESFTGQREETSEPNIVQPLLLKSSSTTNPEKSLHKNTEESTSTKGKEEKSEEGTEKSSKDYSETQRLSSWDTYQNEHFGFSIKNTSAYDKLVVLKKGEKDKNGDDNYLLEIYTFVPVKLENFILIDETRATKTAHQLGYNQDKIIHLQSSCISKTHCNDDIIREEDKTFNKQGYALSYLGGIQEELYVDPRILLTDTEQEQWDKVYQERYLHQENAYDEQEEEMMRRIEEIENMDLSDKEKEQRILDIELEYVNWDEDSIFEGYEEMYQKKYQENGYQDEEDYMKELRSIMNQITTIEINDQL